MDNTKLYYDTFYKGIKHDYYIVILPQYRKVALYVKFNEHYIVWHYLNYYFSKRFSKRYFNLKENENVRKVYF